MKGYTIQNSINLLEDSVKDLEARPSGGGSAADVSYSNTSSGLVATNVQSAIDEIDATVDTISTKVSSLMNMSTTEREVGQTPDGDKIYEKTFTGLSVATSTSTWTEVLTSITDMANIYDIKCFSEISAGRLLLLIPIETSYDSTSEKVTARFVGSSSRTITECTLRYTKPAPAPSNNTRSKKSSK